MKGGLRRDAIIGVQILTMQPMDANYGVPTMGLNAAAVAPLFPFPFSLFPLLVQIPIYPIIPHPSSEINLAADHKCGCIMC